MVDNFKHDIMKYKEDVNKIRVEIMNVQREMAELEQLMAKRRGIDIIRDEVIFMGKDVLQTNLKRLQYDLETQEIFEKIRNKYGFK